MSRQAFAIWRVNAQRFGRRPNLLKRSAREHLVELVILALAGMQVLSKERHYLRFSLMGE